MDVTEEVLIELQERCLNYYKSNESYIRSIILYGSAAKNYFGHDVSPGDFDLNVFFSDQSMTSSTHGMPEIIGEYSGLKVEVMRNVVAENLSVERYVDVQNSKRWNRIREEPIVQIYPEIERIDWS